MSRIPPKPRDQLPSEQQHAHDQLMTLCDKAFGDNFIYKSEDGAMIGPMPSFIAVPGVGLAFIELLKQIGMIPGLPAEARETTILAIGSVFRAGYELYSHYYTAIKTTKLSKTQVEQISKGEKPADLDETCSVAFDVARRLATTPGPLPGDLWNRAEAALGKEGTLALLNYAGMYCYVCVILNGMDAPVPEEGPWS